MSESSSGSGSSGMLMLQPIGGGPAAEMPLQPVGGATAPQQAPVSGPPPLSAVGGATAAQPLPQPPSRPVPPPSYRAPVGAGNSWGPGTQPTRRVAAAAADDEDAVSSGRMIGSILAGLIVGGVCLFGWRWLWDTYGFNLSLIAVAVGFLIGFTMATVADIGTRGNTIITSVAGLLGLAFAIAGVWPSLTGGRIVGITFGVFCAMAGMVAAIKAAHGGADHSSDDDE